MIDLLVKKEEDVVLRTIGGINLLIPSKNFVGYEGNKFFYINQVSAFLWMKMREDITIKQLTFLTQEQFGISDTEQISEDIYEYIIGLSNLGFVKIKKIDGRELNEL